ncbi:MAG: glycosyltransferase family A protein [Polyangiaceae bacterium]
MRLLRAIAETDVVPRNVGWRELSAALGIAARENAYESAELLANDALSRIDDCPSELRASIVRRCIDAWVAAGRTPEILPLLSRYSGDLPRVGYRPENFLEQLPKDVRIDGDRHLAYRAIREGIWSPEAVLAWLDAESSHLRPELELFRCHALGRLGDEEARAALSRYLGVFGVPPVDYPSRVVPNVLDEIRASAPRRGTDGPLVSVVCSAYRAASTLGYAVSSLLNQTHRNLEVLLCDDGSDDDTANVARELAATDGRIRLFRSKGNQGTYNVRNGLLPFARGKYVTFHDSDDYALPVRVEMQLAALARHHAKACVSNWLRILPSGPFVFFRDGNEQRLSIVSLMVERENFVVIFAISIRATFRGPRDVRSIARNLGPLRCRTCEGTAIVRAVVAAIPYSRTGIGGTRKRLSCTVSSSPRRDLLSTAAIGHHLGERW